MIHFFFKLLSNVIAVLGGLSADIDLPLFGVTFGVIVSLKMLLNNA